MTLEEKLKVLGDFCDEKPHCKNCPFHDNSECYRGVEETEYEINRDYKIMVDFINSTNSVISTDSINYTKENCTSVKNKLNILYFHTNKNDKNISKNIAPNYKIPMPPVNHNTTPLSPKMKLCGITKKPCVNGCTPCCDYCIHVLHHFF